VARARGRAALILIDGPSGAGKSRLADALIAQWPAARRPRLVRMDDLYPGWHGLDAASRTLERTLLRPLRTGGSGSWRRWDWDRNRSAELHTVAGHAPLIVEGCGALASANLRIADVSVWLDADDVLRKERALARDGAVFESHWDDWQRDFVRYTARERPREHAALVLDVTGWSLDPGRAPEGNVVP
jgi:uridine kinase